MTILDTCTGCRLGNGELRCEHGTKRCQGHYPVLGEVDFFAWPGLQRPERFPGEAVTALAQWMLSCQTRHYSAERR